MTNENFLGGRFQAGRQAGRGAGHGAAGEMLPACQADRFAVVHCDLNPVPKMSVQVVMLRGHGHSYSNVIRLIRFADMLKKQKKGKQ